MPSCKPTRNLPLGKGTVREQIASLGQAYDWEVTDLLLLNLIWLNATSPSKKLAPTCEELVIYLER